MDLRVQAANTDAAAADSRQERASGFGPGTKMTHLHLLPAKQQVGEVQREGTS
jgi:hypothetical protein